MGRGCQEAGCFMDRLVVRDLGQDGIKRSSAGVVYLLDTKEGPSRLHVLDEAFIEFTEAFITFDEVTPEVLRDLTDGLADLLLETTMRVVHAFVESLHQSIHQSSVSVRRRRHRLRR